MNQVAAIQNIDLGLLQSLDHSAFNLLLEHLNYQSVMDAFGRIFVGSVQVSSYIISMANTSVMSTVLGNVPELAGFRSTADLDSERSLMFSDSIARVPKSIALTANMTGTLNMQDTLEMLFQNITISLMISIFLQ